MRKNGYTTRLIDEAIQTLFATGEVVFRDHHESIEANRSGFRRLVDRLNREHQHLFTNNYIRIKKQEFKIKINFEWNQKQGHP